ncbi:MAG: 30S ribosomal protein S1 [Ignavibacteriae bacterium]|nr:MAG: 30S ribosomal protein S1 [Ignavibacteriota bacterium]
MAEQNDPQVNPVNDVLNIPKPVGEPIEINLKDRPVIKTKDFVAKDYSEDEFRKYIELYEKTFNVIKENEIVKGKVVAVSGNDVLIDIGFKSDGRVSIDEFPDPDNIKIGDEVEIFVEKIEDREGQLVLSRKRADIIRNWERIIRAKQNDELIQGKCVRRIKGGFVVDLGGVNAFLPGSQIDTKPIRDYDVFVGKMMDFKILKINHPNENIIISHKILIEESMADQREKLLSTIEKGQILQATVKAITDFGVFVDLGGVDGLIHITDLSWGRISHPSEVVNLDQDIDVIVLEFDEEKKRVTLGLKQLTPHPWENIEEKLKVGDKVSGKVVSITDYGAFIEIDKGIEGLIHVSEMSWTQHITNPNQVVSMGEIVEAIVLSLDKSDKKLSLGIKQLTPNPWQSLLEKFPIGSRHQGKVCNITNFGVFVELEEGVDGLVHISDLSWTKKIFNVEDFVKVGDMLDVLILGIDIDNHRIALGHKQITDNPWDSLEGKYTVGTEANVKVMKALEKGIIVELPDIVDGFIPASQLSVYQIKNFAELFQYGATLNAEVIEFDKESKKIVLSVIEYLKDKDQQEIDEYIAKFKITKKFTLADVIDRTKTIQDLKEEIDFKIDDVINEPPTEPQQ